MEDLELTQKVKNVLKKINAGEYPNDLSDGNDEIAQTIIEVSCSDGFEYGLWDGGYIKLEDILEGKSLKKAKKASEILKKVRDVWEEISIEF